jgi:DNA-binding transcriptional LysR family regulator
MQISVMMKQNDTPPPTLDIDAVRAFVLVADLQSFTRTAQATGTTQSAVSLKLKRLEARLATRLVERTPRLVRLTAEGASFLDRARELLAAHDRALTGAQVVARRLSIGISDHAAGPVLPDLMARMNAFDPSLALVVEIDFSSLLLDRFDDGQFDAVIVRREGTRRGGELLLEDEFGWFAAPAFRHRPGEKLRLAMLGNLWRPRACDPQTRNRQDPMDRSLHRRRRDRDRGSGYRRSRGRAIGTPCCASRRGRCRPDVVIANTRPLQGDVARTYLGRTNPRSLTRDGGSLSRRHVELDVVEKRSASLFVSTKN